MSETNCMFTEKRLDEGIDRNWDIDCMSECQYHKVEMDIGKRRKTAVNRVQWTEWESGNVEKKEGFLINWKWGMGILFEREIRKD